MAKEKYEIGVYTDNYKICIDCVVPGNFACQGLIGMRGDREFISYIASSREMALKKVYRSILKEIRDEEAELRKKKKHFWNFYLENIKEEE